MVREGIRVTESAVKLAVLGAKKHRCPLRGIGAEREKAAPKLGLVKLPGYFLQGTAGSRYLFQDIFHNIALFLRHFVEGDADTFPPNAAHFISAEGLVKVTIITRGVNCHATALETRRNPHGLARIPGHHTGL